MFGDGEVMYIHCKTDILKNICLLEYCKRGHFRSGKISRKCWHYLSHGGNFHDISPVSLVKSYGFYFPMGEIFRNTIS